MLRLSRFLRWRERNFPEDSCYQVEATKFTEVGFHGADVDTMIADLVANAVKLVKNRRQEQVHKMQPPTYDDESSPSIIA